MIQKLQYPSYNFTPILGWSISRFELFDKCKRQYYYTYYSKFAQEIPQYKLTQLKNLTSVPLEIGNVVHDVIEAFLWRLQKSDSDIDENRFFQYARQKADEYFTAKTFIETYYGSIQSIDTQQALDKISKCLDNFIKSPVYTWIFMKAITNRNNWMIEPPGYGETRLDGLKAYCKMDFLFPVDDDIYILDWKTGGKDTHKHTQQLIGYAAAASSNFGIQWNTIFPKIVYLFPEFQEFELTLKNDDFSVFFTKVKEQTKCMQSFCSNVEKNIPLPLSEFPATPSPNMCRYCNFQELCFDKKKASDTSDAF